MLRTLKYILALALVAGCATGGKSRGGKADLTVVVAEQNARVGDQTFDIRDYDALEAGLAGACASGCDLIEVRSTPGADYEALRTVYQAAVEGRAGQLVMTSQKGDAIQMSPAIPSPCRSELAVRKTGIDVYVDGQALPVGETCSDWGATVCASGEGGVGSYEWASLKGRVRKFGPRFEGPVCLYLERDMNAGLLEHLMQTVQDASPAASFVLLKNRPRAKADHEAITKTMIQNSAALTSCYDETLARASKSVNLTLRFVIIPPGRVSRAGVVDGGGDAKFEQCLVDAVSAIKFPTPENGGAYVINFPLSFSPSQ